MSQPTFDKNLILVSGIALAVQVVSLTMVDPLGYPDTIRYFYFAEFLRNPSAPLVGDLALHNGILFTPLFLPGTLLFLNTILGLSYEHAGVLILVLSFVLLLCGIYLLAKTHLDRRTALVACLIFCAVSPFLYALILTELPFVAALIWLVYKIDQYKLGDRILPISGLAFLLTLIRDQGIALVLIILALWLLNRKLSIRQAAYIILPAIGLVAFNLWLFEDLNQAYPGKLTHNTAFTQSSFALGSSFAEYDPSVSGPIALTANRTILSLAFSSPNQYFQSVLSNTVKTAQFYFTKHPGIPLLHLSSILLLLFYRRKSDVYRIALLLIMFQLLLLVFSLAPYYSVRRYLALGHPFAAIVLSRWLLSILNSQRIYWSAFPIALIAYLSASSFSTFCSIYQLGLVDNHRATSNSYSSQIRSAIGNNNAIALSDTRLYGIVYRSGNRPVYLNYHWDKLEISDFVRRREQVYLLSTKPLHRYLREQGVNTSIIWEWGDKTDPNKHLILTEILVYPVSNDKTSLSTKSAP